MVPMTFVSFTAVRPLGAERRARHVHVHDRVDGMLGQDARYGGLADVRPYEIGTAETVLGSDGVHTDDPVHLGVAQDSPYETAAELAGHSGHEHDLAQDQRLPLNLMSGASTLLASAVTVAGRHSGATASRGSSPHLRESLT